MNEYVCVCVYVGVFMRARAYVGQMIECAFACVDCVIVVELKSNTLQLHTFE